ncbi:MAG: pitrilysin family protein [Polyangiaceae bacterium]
MKKSARMFPRSIRGTLVLTLAAASLAAGCTPPPEPPKTPPPAKHVEPPPVVTAAPVVPEREAPPESGPARELTLPAPAWATLANGLQVASITSNALPIVQIRVVALAGGAMDGDKPGLAALTAQLLKDGGAGGMSSRDLLERVESLGATLDVTTSFDRTTLSIAVTKDQFAEALELVAAVAQKPTLKEAELTKLKKRMIDDATDAASTDGMWGASMMLYKGLYGTSPYATYDATAADLGKLTHADVKAFHKKFFAPKNMFVVVAGDVTADEVNTATEKAFGSVTGGEAPAHVAAPVTPPSALSITIVDRPRSKQSDVMAGVLGPERTAADWPSFAVANQILGGGVASRLFLEVREKSSLAYRTNSGLTELAHAPAPLVAYVGTRTAKTGLAVQALLAQIDRLGAGAPADDEVATATRFLSDVGAIRLETVGAMANELAKNHTLGLPDDTPAIFRKAVRSVTTAEAAKAAAAHVHASNAVLVVAGDAKIIAPMLSHFGEVKVVDPNKSFAVTQTVAKNPDAAIELPDEAGK